MEIIEQWRPITGQPKYEVSNRGRIKSHKSPLKERFLRLSLNRGGYLYAVFSDRKNQRVARLVAKEFLFDYSEDLDVDHMNGEKTDNRVENLRMVTRQENLRGFKAKKVDATSRYRGVCWHKTGKKWVAQLTNDSQRIYLGLFDDQKSAALAYNKKAIALGFSKEAFNKI